MVKLYSLFVYTSYLLHLNSYRIYGPVSEARGEKGRRELLLRSEDVGKLLQGQACVAQPSSAPGAVVVMGSEPVEEAPACARTLQEAG